MCKVYGMVVYNIISDHSYSTEATPEFTGPLAVNQHIANARRVFEDAVQGPEAFAVANGNTIRFLLRPCIYEYCDVSPLPRVCIYRPERWKNYSLRSRTFWL